jgi:toxin-antitoxin system PIN domain toxin
MRALLDVNVLIALLDVDHSLHAAATEWFGQHARQGWASCPITQNGCLRIMSHPAYPHAPPLPAILDRLATATATDLHEFWADEVSLLDASRFDPARMLGPRQITDLYLLALAVKHGGRLVTFDAAISLQAVRGATARHLVQL